MTMTLVNGDKSCIGYHVIAVALSTGSGYCPKTSRGASGLLLGTAPARSLWLKLTPTLQSTSGTSFLLHHDILTWCAVPKHSS